MCRSLFILARYYRTNLKLRIASPASDSKINFVWHCDRFCFYRKLCQTEMMIVSAFSIFYDRKTRAFATRIFVCRAAIHYQSDFNFDTALNTALPFYTNTAFMPHTHINIASISLYCNLLSIQSLDTTLIQKISFYATSFPHRFHATPTTLERCTSTTILPVSSPLDLRFNSTELFKIIACAIMLPQHIAFFLSHRA